MRTRSSSRTTSCTASGSTRPPTGGQTRVRACARTRRSSATSSATSISASSRDSPCCSSSGLDLGSGSPGSLAAVAAPVARDQELELHIDSLAYGGNGVARLTGFVVFVRRGLPGDTVRARVTKVKRSHAEALAVEVVEPSAKRVDAPCAHYPACGGCRFQDLAYGAQLEAKQEQVRDALRRIGGIAEPPLEPILPAESQFFYRNKLEYSFTSTPEGPALGFHKAGRWDEVLEVEKCWLTTELGNAIRNAVRDWAREERLDPYDQAEHTGYLRHLVVREGRNTGQVLVHLVTGAGEKFETGHFVDVLRRFPEVRSIHWARNDSPA